MAARRENTRVRPTTTTDLSARLALDEGGCCDVLMRGMRAVEGEIRQRRRRRETRAVAVGSGCER